MKHIDDGAIFRISMDTYPEALRAMHSLLDRMGESGWRDRIAEDIRQWEEAGAVEHHLSAYGGTASLNDLYFSSDPWADTLFGYLKSVCYHFARTRNRRGSIEEVESSLGTEGSTALEGWRCLTCGHAEATTHGIERFVVSRLIRQGILRALEQARLAAFVDEVLTHHVEGAARERERAGQSVARLGIRITSRDGWMRPCPSCASNNTAAYRWTETGDGDFAPAADNLPLVKLVL